MNPAFHIRPLAHQDGPALVRLNEQLGYDLPLAKLDLHIQQLLLSKKDMVLIAEAEGRVLGYIHGCTMVRLTSPRFLEIVALVVDEKHRRTGVGKSLVEAMAKLTQTQVRVRTRTSRTEAHQFYEALGFRAGKDQTVFYKNSN